MPVADTTHSMPAPGEYLCQVNATTSCGACCGLYNVADNTRPQLAALLAERSARFAAVPREIDALDAFARWSARRAGDPPLAEFHHCPFVGLIGNGRKRVGCLLHPLASGNRGVDLRGLSYYGSFTCRTYFCPSCRALAGRHQRLLKQVFDHWYPYGLVVTETRLVTLLLEAVEARLGRLIDPRLAGGHRRVRKAIGRLLSLKIDWPWRPKAGQMAARVHYLFKDGAHQRPPCTDTAPNHPHGAVFSELSTQFTGREQEQKACQRLKAAIAGAAAALSAAAAADTAVIVDTAAIVDAGATIHAAPAAATAGNASRCGLPKEEGSGNARP